MARDNYIKDRQNVVRVYFSKKIMQLFNEGLPKDERPITYIEAADILEYTLSEIGKRPVLFYSETEHLYPASSNLDSNCSRESSAVNKSSDAP